MKIPQQMEQSLKTAEKPEEVDQLERALAGEYGTEAQDEALIKVQLGSEEMKQDLMRAIVISQSTTNGLLVFLIVTQLIVAILLLLSH